VLAEITAMIRRLGDEAPEHLKARARDMQSDGFFQVRTETEADGNVTIKVVPGHDLLSIWAVLMATAQH
jgi:hypothetical protein